MTTIVDALSRAALQCSISAPSSWVTAARDDHVEFRDGFFMETVDDVLGLVDLPAPIGAQQTITGDGSETYALNSNFKRLHRDDMAVYDNLRDSPCIPVTTDGRYTFVKDTGTSGVAHFYKITGYEGNFSISMYPEPSASSTFTVSYQTVNWMADSGGTSGSMFSAEDDVLLLPRRVVESGTIWRFRERRGLPYMDKFNEYQILLQRLANDRRARRVTRFGGADKAPRWQDMVPSFIPSS